MRRTGINFSFKCLVEFTTEAVWSRTSVPGEVLDYSSNLFTSNWSVQIFCLFYDLVCVGCMFLEMYPSPFISDFVSFFLAESS